MPIPASYIVDINPRLISAGGTDLEFNGLVLTKNELIPTDTMVVTFTTAESVGEYFGLASDEYAQASQYFLGYNNSFAKPARLMFARRITETTQAYLQGGEYTAGLDALQVVTAGGISFKVDDTTLNINNIDLTDSTSYSDVAQKITDAWLPTFPFSFEMTYSSVTNAFTITVTTEGDHTISYASGGTVVGETNLAELLNLTEETGAQTSQGATMMTATENMAAIKKVTQNWVTFTTLYEADDDEILALSEWASDQGVDYLYVAWSDDEQLVTQASTGCIADKLEAANYGATTLVYPNVDTAVFVLGMIASIAWERTNGTITTAFKMADGLTASVTDETTADLLDNKKCGYIGQWATRNDDFTFFYAGAMFGDYSWIDTYINMVWFKNVLQVSIMEGLTNVGRVPYNDEGYTIIRAWLQDPINRAVKNGVIKSGVELSESQKAQVYQETGIDISQELYINGYYVLIEDAGASVRVTRESPNISVYYTDAGAVQKISVAATVLV